MIGRLIAILLFSCMAAFAQISNFTHDTAWMYDEEVVISNLVYAINERAEATMTSWIVTNDCVSPTTRVYRYHVDPIPLESWEIAWGPTNEPRVVTSTNYVSAFLGASIVNTATNVFTVTNRLVSFEYEEGTALPYGYMWIPTAQIGYESVHYGVWPGWGRPDTWYLDETRRLVSNVLVRVVTNDFSNPDGMRLTAGVSYQPCRATNDYYFQITTLMDDIYDRVFNLAGYFLQSPTNRNYAKAMWQFMPSTRRGPVTFSYDGEIPGVVDGALPCPGGVYDEVYGDCWAYVWDNEWAELSLWSPAEDTTPLSIADFFTGTSPVGRVAYWTNALLGVPSSIEISTDGWHVDQATSRWVNVTIGGPSSRAVGSTSTYYAVTGAPCRASIELDPSATNHGYLVSVTSAPIADIRYIISGLVLTSNPPRRVITPSLTLYDVDSWDADGALYTTSELASVSFEIRTTTSSTNAHDPYPDHEIEMTMGILDYSPAFPDGGQHVFEGDYPDGWYWWGIINPTSRVIAIERSEKVVTNLAASGVGVLELVNTMRWHEVRSIDMTNVFTATQTLQAVISVPGVTNHVWMPKYDLLLQHRLYQINPLPRLIRVSTNAGLELAWAERTWSPDLAVDLWAMLKRMRYTRVWAAAFATNNFGYSMGRGVQTWSPLVVTTIVSDLEVDLQGDFYDRSSTNYSYGPITTTNISADISGRFLTSNVPNGVSSIGSGFLYIRRQNKRQGMWAGLSSRWEETRDYACSTLASVSFEAAKHPDLDGLLVGSSTLSYDYQPERADRLVRDATFQSDNGLSYGCRFDATYYDHYFQLSAPPEYAVDLGIEFSVYATQSVDVVSVSVAYGAPPFIPPEVGYDDRGVIPGSDPCTNDFYYGGALGETVVSGIRRSIFYWQWMFKYAAD